MNQKKKCLMKKALRSQKSRLLCRIYILGDFLEVTSIGDFGSACEGSLLDVLRHGSDPNTRRLFVRNSKTETTCFFAKHFPKSFQSLNGRLWHLYIFCTCFFDILHIFGGLMDFSLSSGPSRVSRLGSLNRDGLNKQLRIKTCFHFFCSFHFFRAQVRTLWLDQLCGPGEVILLKLSNEAKAHDLKSERNKV